MLTARRPPPGRSAFAPAVGVKSPPSSPTPATDPSLHSPSPPAPPRSPSLTSLKKAAVHFLSGGLSAGLVRFSLQPLDTIKTRLQASTATASLRCPATLRHTLLQGRGISGLYRGAVPGIVGIVPAAAVYMVTFQFLKTRLERRFTPSMRSVAVAVAAALGDVAACLVRVPCEVVKQRLQVGVYADLGCAMRGMVARGGVGTLYAGLGAQLARDVPYAAVEFVFYERLKEGLGGGRKLGRGESFVVGGLSGAAAAVASNPLDVVKTRLMTGVGGRYGGVREALVTVAREEGVAGFAKGIAPRIAAKTLQSALFFAAYETLKKSIAGALGVEMAKGDVL